jgi:hypothetical protein
MAEWQNEGMAEWQNGGMVEWRNGGMAEWRNGGMAEWQSGIMYRQKSTESRYRKYSDASLAKPLSACWMNYDILTILRIITHLGKTLFRLDKCSSPSQKNGK